MAKIESFLNTANLIVWGPPMLILLVGTHIYLTIRLRFIQKHTFKAVKLSLSADNDSQGDITQFGALATALAATIGTGNIIGVSTAIALGGPGAVLWTWMTGVFGIATKYAEALLALKYRHKNENGLRLCLQSLRYWQPLVPDVPSSHTQSVELLNLHFIFPQSLADWYLLH
jgi:AGCS family alanine or glycine:cation symporter